MWVGRMGVGVRGCMGGMCGWVGIGVGGGGH